MKLPEHLVRDLAEIIIGDNSNIRFPYLVGKDIVGLFNTFCKTKDIYPESLTAFNFSVGDEVKRSRKQYAIDRLGELNHESNTKGVLTKVIQKAHFVKNGHQSIYESTIYDCNEILKSDGFKIELNEDGVASFMGGDVEDDPLAVEIHFKDIKQQILTKIQEAKVIIWIAMAWFTDIDIMREVLRKQIDGLDVKIVVFDERSNIDYGILKNDKKIHYPQLFKIKYDDDRQKMHNKFCIIDMKTVLHGTFNYSMNANKNDETFEVLTDYTKALEFSQEFLRLLKISKNA
ncbi:MAG TPA: phospholipase D-like domain-containing protein [Leadbetterella sp.]|nr:phospholipase D-like domain-containing protein [Leadbetterella sp.]